MASSCNKTWLGITFIAFAFLFKLGANQRIMLDIGPRNITRTEGEINVYIPCPIPGSASPIWIINGMFYEAFNLPENMVSVSFGLLITYVTVEMDGKTFQCMVPTGVQFEFYKSSIGTLTVEKRQSPPDRGLTSLSVTVTPTVINIDHQRTVFERRFKTLSWKNVNGCDGYQMNSLVCNGADIPDRNWDKNAIEGTSIPIPSDFIMYDDEQVYFQLSAVVRSTGAICGTSRADIIIPKNATTKIHNTSFSGFCENVTSLVGLYVVFPGDKNSSNDCPCSIIVEYDNTYQLDDCSCGRNTIFRESFLAYKWRLESPSTYHVCLFNLTREMNNTRIHFYELYRLCIDNYGRRIVHPYRNYFKSFQIQIVLPDPPDVTINKTTGQIKFSSPSREGIDLDYYQIIILDVTNQAVVNSTYTPTDNNISVGDMFQRRVCSPYMVIVEAHNTHGATKNKFSVETNSSDNGDVCNCIEQNVNTDVELVNVDDSENAGISVQVNCSHTYNQSKLYLNITVIHHGISMNGSIAPCEEEFNVPFDFLKCDTSYDLLVSWIATSKEGTSDSECLLNQVHNRMVECPKKHSGSLDLPYIIIIAGGSSGFILISILLIIVAVLVIKLQRNKSDSHNFVNFPESDTT